MLGLALAALALVPSLPAETRKLLDKADSVELLSLDPAPLEKKDGVQHLHGYKILGVLKLGTKEDRAKVLKALYKGIDDSDGLVAACFRPRHGIRAKSGKATIELVICYECLSMTTYVDGKRGSVLTTRSPNAILNKILTDAKIPLPKKAVD